MLQIRIHLAMDDLCLETAAYLGMELVKFSMEVVIYPCKELREVSLMKFESVVVFEWHGSPGMGELVQMGGKSPRTHLAEMEHSVRNLRHETSLSLRQFGAEKTGYRMHVLTIWLFHDITAA